MLSVTVFLPKHTVGPQGGHRRAGRGLSPRRAGRGLSPSRGGSGAVPLPGGGF